MPYKSFLSSLAMMIHQKIKTILGAFMLCHTLVLQSLTITYNVFCLTFSYFVIVLQILAITYNVFCLTITHIY